ncbi:MAG: DNA recombination protein RmuC [Oscillospiraceae bacterium]|nr:DNA recombination protein RmuC [Oscillospiraceae bacterium]
MDYFIAGCTVVCILMLVFILIVLYQRNPGKERSAVHDLLRRMQKEEQKLRREQSAQTNDTIQLSMQMVSDNLSRSQSQTRDTTAAQLRQFEERIQGLESANARSMAQLRETVTEQMELLRSHSDRRLQEIRKTVDDTLQEHLEAKMNESFKRVTESLEAVYKGLGEMKSLASDVGGLKRVLSNVKTRGTLGEIQLGSILQEILAPEQYDTNVETVPGSGRRVEFAIKLPTEDGKPVWLPIDSKFPADCYMQLLDAQDSGEKAAVDAAAQQLRQRIQTFAKDIHDKYLHEPDTTAFGILFLPFEGLYSEVVSSGLTETLQQKYAVNVAGPSTMAAMLNALYMGFRTLAIQKQSDQVWQILSGVKEEFGRFEEALNGTKRKLDAAGKELDQLVGVRTRAINRRLADVQRLGLPSPAPEQNLNNSRKERYDNL